MLSVVLELVCAVLAVWGAQRMITLCAAMRLLPRRPGRPRHAGAEALPLTHVTVQVPLYNEPLVCARAVDAACALRWCGLQVQILDDSDDEVTSRILAERVAHWRARGVDVEHVRRATRDGYKAGALAHGMARAKGEVIAIFDADFAPAPDFLERTVPLLDTCGVDVVQARWDHLNRDESPWTRAQAALLDAHFAVEQQGRSRRTRFFGFNGTAGVWRKAAIERAGGWSARTLTEDLDLSVRAFIGGARFAYVDDVAAPAELPADVRAWRVQQHRWAKGALQTARARLGAVWRAPLGVVDKIDVSLKLLQNLCWPLLAVVVVVLPFAAFVDASSPQLRAPADVSSLAVIGVGLGTVPALAVVAWAARRRGASRLRAIADAALALGVAAALSLHAARASIAGWLDAGDRTFHRTPKAGGTGLDAPVRVPLDAKSAVVLEALVGFLHVAAAIALSARGDLLATPILWLCGVSLIALALRTALAQSASSRQCSRSRAGVR